MPNKNITLDISNDDEDVAVDFRAYLIHLSIER